MTLQRQFCFIREQFSNIIITAQFFTNNTTIRKGLPFAWMKHPVVHMDKASIIVDTEQDMIMSLQKTKKGERNRHAAIQGWLTNCWTDKSARYLTSGFECVIKSITRAFAPNSVTSLYSQEFKKNLRWGKKNNMIDLLLSAIIVLDILTDIIRCNGQDIGIRSSLQDLNQNSKRRCE